MKKLKSILVTLAMLLFSFSASSHDFEVDGIYYNITDSEKLTVEITFRGGTGGEYTDEYSGSVVIPETVIYDSKSYSVTSIGYEAFFRCSNLKSVIIPNTVTSIGDLSFYKCTDLTSVMVGINVTSIGTLAFNQCKSITSITIPNGVVSIGSSAFSNCSSLSSVNIGNSVTSIGEYAFQNCSSLTTIIIPNSVKNIGHHAFDACSLRTLVIGLGVTSIGSNQTTPIKTIWLPNTKPSGYDNVDGLINYVPTNNYGSSNTIKYYEFLKSMFVIDGITYVPVNMIERTCDIIDGYYNNDIENLIITESVSYKNVSMTVKDIMSYSFYENSYIKKATLNNKGIVGDYCFYNCTNLNTIYLEGNLQAINNYAFSGCDNLNNIEIGGKLEIIGNNAFSDCNKLNKVILGNQLKTIGNYAFSGCSLITDLECKSTNPPACGTFALEDIDKWNCTLTIPKGTLKNYQDAEQWNAFIFITESEVDPETPAPPSTTSLTIGSTGSTTFSSIYNLDFSNVDGIKAYTATGYNSDNGELTLVRIKEAKAGTGLYVSGNPGTYTIPTISSTAYNSLNMFVGVNEETTISTTDGSYTNYIYTKPTGKEAGFYKVTTDRAIPAGKAYLQIPTAWLNEETASEAKAVKLVFDDGESTGIDDVNRVESKEDVIYDLQGRRVKNPSKGIYIINGRKVVR